MISHEKILSWLVFCVMSCYIRDKDQVGPVICCFPMYLLVLHVGFYPSSTHVVSHDPSVHHLEKSRPRAWSTPEVLRSPWHRKWPTPGASSPNATVSTRVSAAQLGTPSSALVDFFGWLAVRKICRCLVGFLYRGYPSW